MTSIIRKMTNIGIAGEEIAPGLIKTTQIARNGIFETKNSSWVGGYTKKVSDYVLNASPLIPELEDTYYMKALEKLPMKAFAATYKFYKDVCELNGCEAQINFYINEKNLSTILVGEEHLVIKDIPGIDFWTDTIFSYVPIQDNSGALTSTVDPIYYALRKEMKAHIETHSHNTMSAFKSATDEKNSDIEGLQLVFGNLKSKEYDFKSWVTISGEQFDDVPYQEMLKYIDMPYKVGDIEELIEALDGFETPEQWMTQCKFTTYRAPKLRARKNWDSYKDYSNGHLNKGLSKYPSILPDYPTIGAFEDDELEESSFRKYSKQYYGDDTYYAQGLEYENDLEDPLDIYNYDFEGKFDFEDVENESFERPEVKVLPAIKVVDNQKVNNTIKEKTKIKTPTVEENVAFHEF